jgi:hypothetical protein
MWETCRNFSCGIENKIHKLGSCFPEPHKSFKVRYELRIAKHRHEIIKMMEI